MPEGKFFSIVSSMNGLCLDIQNGTVENGTPIIMWENHGGVNQLWYMDFAQNVIRSKLDDNFVIDNQGGLVLNEYNPDEPNQRWRYLGDRIASVENEAQVMDIADANNDPGASVCVWEDNGGDNQKWEIQYTEAVQCFIRSVDKDDKVMDVKGDDADEGARIVLYEKKDEDNANQIFYEDRNGLIRSLFTDFCFDTFDEGKLRMREYDGDVNSQRWIKSGNKIVHRDDPSKCLQVKPGGLLSLAKVEEGEYSGDSSQKWRFEYF